MISTCGMVPALKKFHMYPPDYRSLGCYFIIGLQDRYGIGDSSGAAQLTMDEVWL